MRHHPRGVIVLFTVLVLGVVAISAATVLARASLEGYLDAVAAQQAWNTRAKVFGCIDESLIHLQADNDWAPVSVTIGSATCTIAVTTPSAGTRQLVASLSENNVTRQATAQVTLSPFAVTQVTEP